MRKVQGPFVFFYHVISYVLLLIFSVFPLSVSPVRFLSRLGATAGGHGRPPTPAGAKLAAAAAWLPASSLAEAGGGLAAPAGRGLILELALPPSRAS